MGFKTPKSEKLYFSISEVAEKFNLAPSALRFWEKEFDTIKPFKNKKGNRFYTQEDIDHLALINHLVKERGLTLKGAKAKIKENEGCGSGTNYSSAIARAYKKRTTRGFTSKAILR